jgi:hypothetical protein
MWQVKYFNGTHAYHPLQQLASKSEQRSGFGLSENRSRSPTRLLIAG